MRFLLPLLLVTVIAAACGGSGDDDLETIERLDFEGMELTIAESFNPQLARGYPSVVVTIDGVDISAQELVSRQVEMEVQRIEALTAIEPLQDAILSEIDNADPLEQLVNVELLAQAGDRLGYTLSRVRAVQQAEDLDTLASGGALPEVWVAIARVQGWPDGGWAESEAVVSAIQRSGTVLAVQEECGPPVPDYSRSQINRDCSAFLAAERENAVIEYFVVWAE